MSNILDKAVKTGVMDVVFELTQAEISGHKNAIVVNCLDIKRAKDKLAVVKAELETYIDRMERENNQLLTELASGTKKRMINGGMVPDFENRIMNYYDKDGKHLGYRRLEPHEREQSLFK